MMVMCKATEECTNEAGYEFQGIKTCYECLNEHVYTHLEGEAIEAYIEENATKLNKLGGEGE